MAIERYSQSIGKRLEQRRDCQIVAADDVAFSADAMFGARMCECTASAKLAERTYF